MQDTVIQATNKEKLNKMEALGIRILQNCRNELYLSFPYLDGAFASLTYVADWQVATIGTDGNAIYFCPEYLLRTYADSPGKIYKGYLHMLLHCLYLHLFQNPESGLREEIWNLACDMAVEFITWKAVIKNGNKKRLFREMTVNPIADPLKTSDIRLKCFHIIEQQTTSGITPQKLCTLLDGHYFPYETEALQNTFYSDDHSLWHRDFQGGLGERKKKWERILSYVSMNRTGAQNRRGTKAGSDSIDLTEIRKSTYDYRGFLRQFSTLGEEMELDLDSFDYIFYHLGLSRYGNLPLIEPLEYKEVNKLEELVIAIDTSGSCSAETVRRFLEETYGILSEKENFFKKMKVHFIQCDCCIQSTAVIHSEEEWKAFSKKITIQGRGGTDFRPVFRYIKEQKNKGGFKKLRALIYFTDGDGIYPAEKPDYETAFVFLNKTEKMKLVPAWALRLVTETGGKNQ